MIKLINSAAMLALAGCATDNNTASQECARTAGCVSSFTNTGYGPIQEQAIQAAPSPSRLQPQ